jgi:arsenate reductase
MHEVTIYHNPSCGTSRNTLALLKHAGIDPTVIEYLKNPPTKNRLKDLIVKMNLSVRELLRKKGTPYEELQLDLPTWSDDELIDFMLAHPILINRPIVITKLGVQLCRPSEAVLSILPIPQILPFTKEDGVILVDSGQRVVSPLGH